MSHTDSVQALYAAFQRQDMPAILALVTDDVVWDHSALASAECPWNGDFSGRARLPGFFQVLAEALDFHVFDIRSIVAAGDQVAVHLRIESTVRRTGRLLANDCLHLWTFDAAGRVSRYRHFNDTAAEVAAWRG